MLPIIFSISGSIAVHTVATDRLTQEIQMSSITVALDYIGTEGDELDIYFKADLSSGELAVLSGIVQNHSGISLDSSIPLLISGVVDNMCSKDADNNILVVDQKTTASSIFFISHNYCDPCSWYAESVRISGEIMSWNGSVYNSAHAYWIDLTHGRMTGEDSISSSYLPVVSVSGVVKTEGTDYTINYESGSVTPITWVGDTTDISVTYSYASGSGFYFPVIAGKKVKIDDTEVQRSVNIALNQHIIDFDILVNGSRIGGRAYKNYKDYLNVSNKAYPIVPAGGELTQDVQILHWDYPGAIYLKNSTYSIRCKIRGDQPFTGEFFVVTCYGTSWNA